MNNRYIWRVGRKLGRTIYINDVCIGMVDDVETAKLIVSVMNKHNQDMVRSNDEVSNQTETAPAKSKE
jgi:hypothetical protein